MDPLSATIERIARSGAAQFANWKPALFHEYCRAILPRLADPALADGFAEAVREGIGRGYLAGGPANLMDFCLRGWLVDQLGTTPAGERLPLLVKTWNLLEGLLREPAWVNAYAMARSRELAADAGLDAFLVRVLRPLFEPAGTAEWGGPFRVTALSLRAGHDDFLPGDMHLVAPTILAIKDRRHDVACGVILRKQGQSELAGIFGETSPYAEQPPTLVPHWQGGTVAIGPERVALPFFAEPFRWIQSRAGFVAASAVNSQKLWIVESAT